MHIIYSKKKETVVVMEKRYIIRWIVLFTLKKAQ